jgi:hypothetical protein
MPYGTRAAFSSRHIQSPFFDPLMKNPATRTDFVRFRVLKVRDVIFPLHCQKAFGTVVFMNTSDERG